MPNNYRLFVLLLIMPMWLQATETTNCMELPSLSQAMECFWLRIQQVNTENQRLQAKVQHLTQENKRLQNDVTKLTDAVQIAKNGNVGIGSKDPGAKLHVAGEIKIDGDDIYWAMMHAAVASGCAATSPIGDSVANHIAIPHHAGKTCSWSCQHETAGLYTSCRTSIAIGSILRTRATAYGQIVSNNYNYGCNDNQSSYDEVKNQGVNSGGVYSLLLLL
ncbi:hypothetical protein TI05_00075 [Achromatium sp. WMS3]|nr:hypothetical protein TI05_00075 [Achromatium sp. WMS3]